MQNSLKGLYRECSINIHIIITTVIIILLYSQGNSGSRRLSGFPRITVSKWKSRSSNPTLSDSKLSAFSNISSFVFFKNVFSKLTAQVLCGVPISQAQSVSSWSHMPAASESTCPHATQWLAFRTDTPESPSLHQALGPSVTWKE